MSETRDAYVTKLKAQIDQWNARIDKLEAEGKRLRAEARAEYDERMAQLLARRDAVRKMIADLQAAGETRWQALKAATERARDEFRKALEDSEKKGLPPQEPPKPS